jgi:glycosyltransferase involved in cell wall biosynthesis
MSNASKTASPKITAVIPCRNERAHIEACVRSVLAQDGISADLEVIVVDGMSDDGTREILRRLADQEPRLRIIENPAGIVPTGLNAAIRSARGNVILRMDAHTEYATDYMRQCLATLRQTRADNVGGPARTKGEGYIQSAICAAYQSRFAVGGARFHDVNYEGYVDTVPYGCWPREVFERIGLFDEELVRNQDDEFNLRLVRAGGKIWQSPRIKSWYRPRPLLSALIHQYLQYGYWKVRVIQKHKIPASVRHLVPGCFVFLLAGLPVAALLWTPAVWIWLGLVAAYTGCIIAASLLAAAEKDYRLFPLLLITFPCFHIGYGYGFLRGICDFIILRRKPGRRFTLLTRAAARFPSGTGAAD